MENELITKRAELEKQLQSLQQRKATMQQFDSELNLSIIKLQTEIERINNRIKSIKHNQKMNDLSYIREVLGVSFDNHAYSVGKDQQAPQMISKTAPQLQMEYMSLLNKLDQKLDNKEINDTQYESIYNALTSLYNQYKEELSDKKEQATSNTQKNESTHQEETKHSQPTLIDKVDDFVELLRKKYGYYDKNMTEREEIDRIIQQEFFQEIYQEKEPLEDVDHPRRM